MFHLFADGIPSFNSTDEPSQTVIDNWNIGQTEITKEYLNASICARKSNEEKVEIMFTLSLNNDNTNADWVRYVARLMTPFMSVQKEVGYKKKYNLLQPLEHALKKDFGNWNKDWVVEMKKNGNVANRLILDEPPLMSADGDCVDVWSSQDTLKPTPTPTDVDSTTKKTTEEADSAYEGRRGKLAAVVF